MTAEKFNELSLDKKFSWLKKQMDGKFISRFANLTFRNMTITYMIGALNDRPASATAEPLPDEIKDRVIAWLNKNKAEYLITDCGNHPEYLEKVFNAGLEISNRKN